MLANTTEFETTDGVRVIIDWTLTSEGKLKLVSCSNMDGTDIELTYSEYESALAQAEARFLH